MSRKWPISEGTLWSQRKPNDCQQAFKSWGKGMEWISHLQDHGPEDMLILNSQAPEMLDNTFLCWSYLVCNSYYSNLNALTGAMYSEAQCDPTALQVTVCLWSLLFRVPHECLGGLWLRLLLSSGSHGSILPWRLESLTNALTNSKTRIS